MIVRSIRLQVFFKYNNISISSENINLIIEKCSGDRKNLQNELDKIFNYCFENKKISRDEIIKLINIMMMRIILS